VGEDQETLENCVVGEGQETLETVLWVKIKKPSRLLLWVRIKETLETVVVGEDQRNPREFELWVKI
jgi:hypothetical protein